MEVPDICGTMYNLEDIVAHELKSMEEKLKEILQNKNLNCSDLEVVLKTSEDGIGKGSLKKNWKTSISLRWHKVWS